MTNFDKLWQTLTNFDKFWQISTNFDRFWHNLTNFDNAFCLNFLFFANFWIYLWRYYPWNLHVFSARSDLTITFFNVQEKCLAIVQKMSQRKMSLTLHRLFKYSICRLRQYYKSRKFVTLKLSDRYLKTSQNLLKGLYTGCPRKIDTNKIVSTVEGALWQKCQWRKRRLIFWLLKSYISFWSTLSTFEKLDFSIPWFETPFPFYD